VAVTCCCEAFQVGEDYYAECARCGYRERNFETLAEAQAAADRHDCDD
jgi:hypothetical protein